MPTKLAKDAVVTERTASSPKRRGSAFAIVLAVVLLLCAVLAWRGWVAWRTAAAEAQARADATEQRVLALEQRIESLRRDQRAQTQRILDAAATHRVLRDEVLGLSQRGALLEDSVSKLADPTRHGPQALRLDEVELLLSQAAQRLSIAGDVAGARRAYALAAGALQGVDDPRLLNLRQALAQERAALDALGASSHAVIAGRLDAFSADLGKLAPRNPAADNGSRPAWQRVLAPLVDIRPGADETRLPPSERASGEAALQIELGLARAALERDDAVAFRAALARVDAWLPRLWPDSPTLRQHRKALDNLRSTPLQPALPVLGSTLQQLRALRNARVSIAMPGPAPAPPVSPLPENP